MDHPVPARHATLAGVGPVRQLAYVVPDLNAAMGWWTNTLGVGPFFYSLSSRQTDVRYRGQPSTIDFSMALSYWGDLQIELIQPNDDRPSIYREALDARQQGLHHVCVYTDDMEDIRARIAAAGGEIIHEGRLPGGELLYADIGGGPGTLYEVLLPPAWIIEMFDRIRQATISWDGSDPVRPLSA